MRTEEETIFKIETKAISESLKIARDFEFKRVEAQCDNAIVIEMILAGHAANSKLSELQLIHQLLDRNWRVHFRHIQRDQNKVADRMTKLSSLHYNEIQIFTKNPELIKSLLKLDFDHLFNIT